MVDKEILEEKNKIVGDVGKVALGLIMMAVSVLNLFGIQQTAEHITYILLFFGGFGTIMWGFRK